MLVCAWAKEKIRLFVFFLCFEDSFAFFFFVVYGRLSKAETMHQKRVKFRTNICGQWFRTKWLERMGAKIVSLEKNCGAGIRLAECLKLTNHNFNLFCSSLAISN